MLVHYVGYYYDDEIKSGLLGSLSFLSLSLSLSLSGCLFKIHNNYHVKKTSYLVKLTQKVHNNFNNINFVYIFP